MVVEFGVNVVASKTLDVSGDTLSITLTDINETITEVGLFNASSGGNMLIRRVFEKPVVMTGATHIYKIDIEFAVHDI